MNKEKSEVDVAMTMFRKSTERACEIFGQYCSLPTALMITNLYIDVFCRIEERLYIPTDEKVRLTIEIMKNERIFNYTPDSVRLVDFIMQAEIDDIEKEAESVTEKSND